MRLLNTGSSSAQYNMALDRAILAGCRDGTSPATVRFYRWESPALSIGYSQEPERVLRLDVLEAEGIDLVRRPTGGGVILHGTDLCYSVAAPVPGPCFPSTLSGSYRIIGDALILFLNALGIEACWGGGDMRGWRPSGVACFESASPFEILSKGRKIVGSAQRRTSGAFLQQGSIMLDGEPGTIRAIVRSGPLDRLGDDGRARPRRTPRRSATALPIDLLAKYFEKRLGVECIPGFLNPREKVLLEEAVRENQKSCEWDGNGVAVEGGRGTDTISVDGRAVQEYSFAL